MTEKPTSTQPTLERLQKVLAARGVASRRAAEALIVAGEVSVDGQIVTELGTKVNPETAVIRVSGRLLKMPQPAYFILNKPRGYITTASDPEGRRTIFDLFDPADLRGRIYPVGRLDMDSEGLLLMTNDGELAHRIAHPRYRIDKEYNALVTGHPSAEALARLSQGGFLIDGGRTSPAGVSVMGQEGGDTWLKIVIHEGRKRQVRRMLEEIGHPVIRLRRVRLGHLSLAGLPAAAYRPLTPEELQRLRVLVKLVEPNTTGRSARAADIARRAPTQTLRQSTDRAKQQPPDQHESGPRQGRGEQGRSTPPAWRRPGNEAPTRAGGKKGGQGDRQSGRPRQRPTRP